jgi:hypothetical protein
VLLGKPTEPGARRLPKTQTNQGITPGTDYIHEPKRKGMIVLVLVYTYLICVPSAFPYSLFLEFQRKKSSTERARTRYSFGRLGNRDGRPFATKFKT